MRTGTHIIIAILLLISVEVCFGGEVDFIFPELPREWTFKGPGGRYGIIKYPSKLPEMVVADVTLSLPAVALIGVVAVSAGVFANTIAKRRKRRQQT
jgi:hypothetical protein